MVVHFIFKTHLALLAKVCRMMLNIVLWVEMPS